MSQWIEHPLDNLKIPGSNPILTFATWSQQVVFLFNRTISVTPVAEKLVGSRLLFECGRNCSSFYTLEKVIPLFCESLLKIYKIEFSTLETKQTFL
jgi:hypothetical protein